MDEEIERLVISVRADTQGFARDVAEMRGTIDGPLQAGADRAGDAIERAMLRAARTGKLGFEDLKRVALQVLGEIASEAMRGGLNTILGRGGGGGLGGALSGLLGLPGRATGGPVTGGRAYVVGERGPELFVPAASGRVEAPQMDGNRDVRVAITINAPRGENAAAMQQSSRQVARAVRAALMEAE
ncbi:tail tape measure protein [Sphingomonas turrisvirgatae]|uniref:Tail tape measure protein n=1 Tax=Sphingomonas turrisvirgatae TaxID=1888892 RepID=A0A1E3LTJ7_9SPHN|nr:tail tape measure protein [Sphingomonas turrisvirgatae]ODP37034.1 tail tape measure protein [Sphingomonas turrisvirgatae]